MSVTGDVELIDGFATYMGDGIFMLQQLDAELGPQNVVLQRADLEKMLAAL